MIFTNNTIDIDPKLIGHTVYQLSSRVDEKTEEVVFDYKTFKLLDIIRNKVAADQCEDGKEHEVQYFKAETVDIDRETGKEYTHQVVLDVEKGSWFRTKLDALISLQSFLQGNLEALEKEIKKQSK